MWYDVSWDEVIKGKRATVVLLLLLTSLPKGNQGSLNTTCSDDTKFVEDVVTECVCVFSGRQARWIVPGVEANVTGKSPLVVSIRPSRQHHSSTAMCVDNNDDESGLNKSFVMNVEYPPAAVSFTCLQKRPWKNGSLVTCTCTSNGGNPQPARLHMSTRLLSAQGPSPLSMKLVTTDILNGHNITCKSIVAGNETSIRSDYLIKIAFGETLDMKIIKDGGRDLEGGVLSVQYNARAFLYCLSGSSYPPTLLTWNHSAQDKTSHLLTSSGGVISVKRVTILSKRRESLVVTCTGSNLALNTIANKSVLLELIGPPKSASSSSAVDLSLFLWGLGGFAFGVISTLAIGAVLSHVTKASTQVKRESHNNSALQHRRKAKTAKSNNARRPPFRGRRRCRRPRHGRSMQERHRPPRRRQHHGRNPREVHWETSSSSSSTSSSPSYSYY